MRLLFVAGAAILFIISNCRRLVKALAPSLCLGAHAQPYSCLAHRTRPYSCSGRTHGLHGRRLAGAANADRSDTNDVAERIYQLVGREFDIGKPSELAKVLFNEIKVFDPEASGSYSQPPEARSTGGRAKPKSVSVKTLSAILRAENDPVKSQLVRLVLDWLDAKSVAKRGGFVASGAKVAEMPNWASVLIPDHDELAADPAALPVLLIDGHYIIFRSFHAMPPLSAPDGTPVGALVGFCNVINKLVVQPWLDGTEPFRKVVVALDTGQETFRHKLYQPYKADRVELPEDLRPQFALIRRACEAYGLDTIRGIGYEADDIIASLAFEAVTDGATDVTIVSADKDLAQLVTRRVNLFNCYTEERLGPDEVVSKYLAPPGRLADLLAIAGDRSDGIVGADGYGPVKAAKVLAKHETLVKALEEICSGMSKKNTNPALIRETRTQVMLARKLVDLCTAVPLDQRTGPQTLDAVQPFQLDAGEGAARLLDFMRDVGLPDLIQRTSKMLGVDEDGEAR